MSTETYVYPCHGGYTGEVIYTDDLRPAHDSRRRVLARIFKTREGAEQDVHEIAAWVARGRPRDAWWWGRH